jgi:hypothetical protein
VLVCIAVQCSLTFLAVSSYPRQLDRLAERLEIDHLPQLVLEFLESRRAPGIVDAMDNTTALRGVNATVHRSARAVFFAPSDPSGVGGMKREMIRAVPAWRKTKKPRRDTIFIKKAERLPGMRGLSVARVYHFFNLRAHGHQYPCALVHWFKVRGDNCDEDTGMWLAEPSYLDNGLKHMALVALQDVFRASHLCPVFSAEREHWVPVKHSHMDSLDVFRTFYVNKFIDSHAFKIAF